MGKDSIYNKVVNFDFASLYPTTMRTYIDKQLKRKLKIENLFNIK